MERGLYAAASGMIAQQTLQDTLAQNLANTNTVGYKQDNATFRAMHGMALRRLSNGTGSGPKIGDLGVGVGADKVYTDWQTGPLAHTGNPLDASLGDNQFFAVSTPRGERYTRAGDFNVDARGNLLTGSGLTIEDTNGRPINVGNKTKLGLDAIGNLTSNGLPIAKLKIVQADVTQLVKDGDSLFSAKAPTAVPIAANPTVRPATLEQSNASPVRGLVQMITVSRGFEMAQRALTAQDDLLKHAANELGKM